ncbi:MAG: hypothetical protein ACREFP_09605 [Acetobacteraceae bacterium]
MTRHKFTVGQTVDFNAGSYGKTGNSGRYMVRRLLPSETGDLQYRVQNVADGHERVVRESQLRDAWPQIFKTDKPTRD